MIAWQHNTDISQAQIDDFRESYRKYAGDRWEKIISARDWEYAIVLNHLHFNPNDRVVDIGGACCDLWFFCNPNVQLIDIVDDASSSDQWYASWKNGLIGQNNYKNGRIQIRRQNARSLPYMDESIDKVVSISALEHFEDGDDTSCAQEIYRVLKPGGLFVGTVDFNHLNELPMSPGGPAHVYTVDSFFKRIIEPSGFACEMPDMGGFDGVEDRNYIGIMFFKLEK